MKSTILIIATLFLLSACSKKEDTVIPQTQPVVKINPALGNYTGTLYMKGAKGYFSGANIPDITINNYKFSVSYGHRIVTPDPNFVSISDTNTLFLNLKWVNDNVPIYIGDRCFGIPRIGPNYYYAEFKSKEGIYTLTTSYEIKIINSGSELKLNYINKTVRKDVYGKIEIRSIEINSIKD